MGYRRNSPAPDSATCLDIAVGEALRCLKRQLSGQACRQLVHDRQGRIEGCGEILDASTRLHPDLLKEAEILS
jgi:hypothetical protein